MRIELPWPARELHPNARVHWSVRAASVKAARALGFFSAVAAGCRLVTLPAGKLHLWWDFYPPDRRKRDDDGLLTCMKAARDGIADALGIDDSRFVSHPYVREEIRKGGAVVVTITGGPESAEALKAMRVQNVD